MRIAPIMNEAVGPNAPRHDLVEIAVDVPLDLADAIEQRGLSLPDVLREVGRALVAADRTREGWN